jgi:hypothetical protein
MKTDLLDAYLSGEIRGESAVFIEAALKSDDALREAYFHQVRMDAALRVLLADEDLVEVTPDQFAAGIMARLAAESRGSAPAADRRFAKSVLMEILDERGSRPRPMSGWDWVKAGMVAAAAVALSVLLLQSVRLGGGDAGGSAETAEFFVAQVTATSPDADWSDRPRSEADGAVISKSDDGWLRPGRFELRSGVAEITFTSGARVFLEGPAVLNVERPGRGYLERGRLTAEVPKAATGFVINTPRINVVDLGTRFGVSVDDSGDTEVHVMQGVVEVSRLSGNASPMRLVEGMAVRADDRTRSDLLAIEYGGDQFPLRVGSGAGKPRVGSFIHYGFNESGGPEIEDAGRGMEGGAYDATIFPDSAGPVRPKRSIGRFGGGLAFAAGERFDSPLLPGIAGDQSLSLALWVRLPPQLEDSDAAPLARLVTQSEEREAGSVGGQAVVTDPVWEVLWNDDPWKGKTGALTVRSGDAFVIGATDLRDGRWHHVAFRFVGGVGADLSTHLHLYVDGRLEAASGHRAGRVKPGDLHRIQVGGVDPDRTAGFEGNVDEVLFFPSAVLPGLIQDLAEGTHEL